MIRLLRDPWADLVHIWRDGIYNPVESMVQASREVKVVEIFFFKIGEILTR